MELSPLAKEKLAKAGELSESEKEKMRLSEELTTILADFFTQKLDNDGLWKKFKQYKDAGKDSIIRETQIRLAHTLSVGGSDFDFDRYSKAFLSLETLKPDIHYSSVESALQSIKNLRGQYIKEKSDAFNSMKERLGSQVRKAAQQMAMQGKNKNTAIDVEGSIEASVKASPQWRDFVIKYENSFNQKFESLLMKLVQLV